jgi:hypothetical protein
MWGGCDPLKIEKFLSYLTPSRDADGRGGTLP